MSFVRKRPGFFAWIIVILAGLVVWSLVIDAYNA